MAKIIKVDKDGFVALDNFADVLDIGKVEFYSLKVNKDKTITVKFYDNKKKLVRAYEKR
jgi:hypothetical protein